MGDWKRQSAACGRPNRNTTHIHACSRHTTMPHTVTKENIVIVVANEISLAMHKNDNKRNENIYTYDVHIQYKTKDCSFYSIPLVCGQRAAVATAATK